MIPKALVLTLLAAIIGCGSRLITAGVPQHQQREYGDGDDSGAGTNEHRSRHACDVSRNGYWTIARGSETTDEQGALQTPSLYEFYLSCQNVVLFLPELCQAAAGNCDPWMRTDIEWRDAELFFWDLDTGWRYLATSAGDGFVRRETAGGAEYVWPFIQRMNELLETDHELRFIEEMRERRGR